MYNLYVVILILAAEKAVFLCLNFDQTHLKPFDFLKILVSCDQR